jgi:hypothetical protein
MTQARRVKTVSLVVAPITTTKQQQDSVLLVKAIMGVLGIKYLLAVAEEAAVLVQLEQQLLLTVLVMAGRG